MAVKLESGKYVPDQTVTVYHWPKPDVDGDGDPVYEDKFDPQGVMYARDEVTDEQGNSVSHYLPPDGFQNKMSIDNTDNYVLVDARGRIVRSPQGHAYNIREGQTLVIKNGDGSYYHLEGDYAHTMFAKYHSLVAGEPVDEVKAAAKAAAKAAVKKKAS